MTSKFLDQLLDEKTEFMHAFEDDAENDFNMDNDGYKDEDDEYMVFQE